MRRVFCDAIIARLARILIETRATYTVGNSRAVYTKRDIDFIAA